jgi:hypothetical protein
MFPAKHIVLTVKGEHLLTRAWGGSLTYTYVGPHMSINQSLELIKGAAITMHPYGDETIGNPLNFEVEQVIGGQYFDPNVTSVQIRSTIATYPWLDYYRFSRNLPEGAYVRQKVLDYAILSDDHYTLHVIEQDTSL